jgi:hypothetical protein
MPGFAWFLPHTATSAFVVDFRDFYRFAPVCAGISPGQFRKLKCQKRTVKRGFSLDKCGQEAVKADFGESAGPCGYTTVSEPKQACLNGAHLDPVAFW